MANKKYVIQALVFLAVISTAGVIIWKTTAGTWKTDPIATSRITITTSAIQHYDYQKDITFNTTATGAAVSTNQGGGTITTGFPVAVHINSSSFPTAADRTHFFNDTYNPAGKRVQFFDSDETTVLNYEVEYYSTANQEALYWVSVPTVTGNSSTDKIVVAYGNDPNSSDQDNKTGVWDSNFKGVWHLGEASTPAYDSTINANNGTWSGNTQTTGQVNSGANFNNDDEITFSAKIIPLGAKTVSLWVKTASDADGVIDESGTASTNHGSSFYITGGKLYFINSKATDGQCRFSLPPNTVINNNVQRHCAYTWDGTTNANMVKAYTDGSADGTGTALTTESIAASHNLKFGNLGAPYATGYYYTGIIDEIRFSNTNRSAGWIKLEYYSMAKTNFNGDNGVSSPFINFGSQEATR